VVSGTKHDGVFIYDQDANNPAQEVASFATVYARRPLPGSKVLAFLTYTDQTAAGPASRRAAAQSPLQAAYSSVSSSDSPFSAHRAALAEQLAALTQGCEQGQFWSVSCSSLQSSCFSAIIVEGLADSCSTVPARSCEDSVGAAYGCATAVQVG
jgi:hypothetical protein